MTRGEQREEGDERAYDANADSRWLEPTRAPLVRYFGIKAKQPLLDVTHEAASAHPDVSDHVRVRACTLGPHQGANRGLRTSLRSSFLMTRTRRGCTTTVTMAKHFVTLLWMSAALAATCTALPTNDKNGSENDLMASIYTDCLKKESISCIKYKVFTFVDKMLADKEDITLSEGITVVKTSNAEEGAPRSVVDRSVSSRETALSDDNFEFVESLRLILENRASWSNAIRRRSSVVEVRKGSFFFLVTLATRGTTVLYIYIHIFDRSIESSDLDTLLFDRLGRFLKTHSVKVDLKGSDILGAIESAGRSFEDLSDNAVESRGKKSEYIL